jgi:hypothetical protein
MTKHTAALLLLLQQQQLDQMQQQQLIVMQIQDRQQLQPQMSLVTCVITVQM